MAIPEQWLETQLRYLCAFEYGKSLPADSRRAGRFPVFGSNGVVGCHDTALVSGPGIIIGRKGSIGEVAWSTIDFWPIDTTYYIRLKESADLQWLFYLLQELGLRSLNTATGIPGLNRDVALDLLVGIPPLPEQKKIAAVLSSVDAAIEKTEAVIAQLQVVKKAMMEQLLTKGLPGRHTRFKQTELGEIPEEWEVVPIGDLCEVITKGATPKGFCSELDGGIPFLRVQNISRSGYLDLSHSAMFITHQDHTGELQRSQIRPGDVLMNIVGPPLGKIAIVPPSLPQANINQAIAVLRPTKVESAYLALCLQADHLFGWALRQAKRTSSQLNLTLESCRCFPIPLPTATERAQLIAVCAAMQSLNDSTQSELAALHEIKSSLSSSLLSGELRVPTDSVPCPV